MPEAATVPDSEADVLHFMLRSRAARAHALGRLTGSDFASTSGCALFSALREVHGHGEPVDPSSVARAANAATSTVTPLWDRTPYRTDIECVQALLAESTRRNLKAALGRIAARVDDAPLDYFRDALAEARVMLPSADLHVDVPNVAEFLTSIDTTYDWLMPWMVERGERVMIVAPEGSGKTVLLRQWAFQLAAGCHWVTGRITPPHRVLYVDAENSDVNIARASRHLYRLASRYAEACEHGWDDDRLRIQSVWNLDITTNREQRDTIEGWLERYRPDLLVIGPIYKVGRNSRALSYEDAALAVTDVIDGWRQRFGIAVAMEHHAPSAQDGGGERVLNPFGSTVWRRWPDVGIGLKYEIGDDGIHRFKVRPFRGYRGSHLFPPEFHRSDSRADTWPWVADGHSPRDYERDRDHQSY
jgi:replicative DNA helicase